MTKEEFDEKIAAHPKWRVSWGEVLGAKWFKIDRVPYEQGYPSIGMSYADPKEFDKNIEAFLDLAFRRVEDGRPMTPGWGWPWEEDNKPTQQ